MGSVVSIDDRLRYAPNAPASNRDVVALRRDIADMADRLDDALDMIRGLRAQLRDLERTRPRPGHPRKPQPVSEGIDLSPLGDVVAAVATAFDARSEGAHV